MQFVCTECHNYETKKLSIFKTDSIIPKVTIPVKTKFGYRKEVFLLDTGADITMLPASAKELFDRLFESCSQLVYGIEGKSVNIIKSRIKMKICEREIDVRCVFSQRDDIPFILGRLDILKKFNIHFYDSRGCFEERV